MVLFKNITKEEFLAYEKVRKGGLINMVQVAIGCSLSGLDEQKWLAIIRHYDKLNRKWPEVRGKK